MQVLIVKMSSMGDVLHTLPALTDAVHAVPSISFDWVIEENFVEIPTWHSAVRHVISVAIRRWRNNWFALSARKERCDFKHQLQQRHYDAIIDAQGLMKSAALVTRLARGERHGMNYKSAREPFASWFYNQRHEVGKQQHAIERIRQLFSVSLGYPVPLSLGDYAIAKHFKAKLDRVPYLMFLHSTTRSGKHWPESHWRTLIQYASDASYQIKLPWKEEHERQRAQRLAEGFRQAEVLPRLTLAQVGEELVGAMAVISVDTGISHLAAALHCLNLTLYGPSKPELIGSYGRSQYVLRSPDGTMVNLTPERVWQVFKVCLLSGNNNRLA